MNIYPEGTILYEENNIRYEIYSEKYFEQTLQCIIESRTEQGTIYADFSIDKESIEKVSEEFLKSAVIKIIALDISKETPKVVGQILGEDFTTFENNQKTISSNKKVNVLKQINKRLITPLTNMQYQQGDIFLGSGYGVKKEYQNMNIGKILSKLVLSVCLESPYKIICGLFYSRKAAYINQKTGGHLMSELSVEECTDLDKDISSYMKNGVQIVGYIDTNKDLSNLRLPQTNFEQPSL